MGCFVVVDDCGGVYVDSVCCCIEIVYLVAWFVWVLLLGWCDAGWNYVRVGVYLSLWLRATSWSFVVCGDFAYFVGCSWVGFIGLLFVLWCVYFVVVVLRCGTLSRVFGVVTGLVSGW